MMGLKLARCEKQLSYRTAADYELLVLASDRVCYSFDGRFGSQKGFRTHTLVPFWIRLIPLGIHNWQIRHSVL